MLRHVALVGPTAAGKSSLAMEIARRRPDFELVSVDSMQVYRGMDIGTAKPSIEEQEEVPHHVLDLVDATDEFTLAEFQAAALRAVEDIEARGKRALLVGGTGLYLRSIVDGFELPGQYPEVRAELEQSSTEQLYAMLLARDPVAAAKVESGNRRRLLRALEVVLGSGRPFSSFGPGMAAHPRSRFLQLGIWLPREVGAARIGARVRTMLERGWVDEVARLQADGGFSATAGQALGYPELRRYLQGAWTLAEVEEEVVRRTRAFARRQRVWFRRDPRIVWHGTSDDPARLLGGLLRDCAETRSLGMAPERRGVGPEQGEGGAVYA